MRFYQHTVFSLAERIEIQAGLRAGHTQRAIAIRLGRSASALSTKLKRHGGRVGYCAQAAHRAAHERRARVHRDCYATNQTPPLRDAVHAQFRRGWSTEEIAGMLEYEHPRQAPMHTSHESIYRYFYVIARGELQRKLTECLRRSHRTRQPQRRGVTATQGKIPDMVLVDERPAEVEDRLIAGRYEGDLIMGAGNRSAVGVLVERTTRFTMLCHLPQKDAQSVREAFTRRLDAIPLPLCKTLNYDQGKEMAQHRTFAADLDLKVFFCHPPQPLVARHLRKPERLHPPLPAQRHRPVQGLLLATHGLSGNAQRTSPQNPRLEVSRSLLPRSNIISFF